MTTLTFEEAQRDLSSAAQKVLRGEEVGISVDGQLLRLVREVPSRPPGYFAECYRDVEDAAFEERLCQYSKPILEERGSGTFFLFRSPSTAASRGHSFERRTCVGPQACEWAALRHLARQAASTSRSFLIRKGVGS